MIRHHGRLPYLNLRIEVMDLGQFLRHNSMAKGGEDNMREVCRIASCMNITFEMPE